MRKEAIEIQEQEQEQVNNGEDAIEVEIEWDRIESSVETGRVR